MTTEDTKTTEDEPLIGEKHMNTALPPTWCVAECMQGCRESWTIDAADFMPRLTVDDAERLLTPFLLDHEASRHAAQRTGA